MPRYASSAVRFGARAVDGLIPGELLTDASVRLRARVLVGAAVTFIVIGVLSMVGSFVDGRPILLPGFVAPLVCHVLALAALRLRRSIQLGTFLLCLGIVTSTALFAAQEGGLYVTTTAWVACVPLLTAFLAGGRNAIIAAASVLVVMFAVWLLHANGMALSMWEAPGIDYLPAWLATISAHFVVAMFAWRYSVERAETLEQLNRTVRGLEEHRDRLASVLESAAAVIVSTDRNLRVTAFNAAARQVAQSIGTQFVEGGALLDALPEPLAAVWRERFQRVLAGETLAFEIHSELVARDYEISIRPVGEGEPTGLTLFAHDVTERKEAARTLAQTRLELIELSRVAGMADVATGVLHNVGNALNSAKTSSFVLKQHFDDLAKPRLARLVALLPEDPVALSRFVVDDPRGGRVVRFLQELSAQAERITAEGAAEIERLEERLEHIRHIVAEQQTFAKRKRALTEECDARELVRTAVELTAGRGAGDVVVEEGPDVPTLVVDRHKVIQILGNLVANARESTRDAGVEKPRVAIRTARSETGVRIEVEDNGSGMEPTTLARVFEHGFTTKSYGHGFGLHTAANQIEELGGRVTARSDGPGKGAVFILDLPVEPPRRATGS
jgi:PAS domain S-box-containing protein